MQIIVAFNITECPHRLKRLCLLIETGGLVQHDGLTRTNYIQNLPGGSITNFNDLRAMVSYRDLLPGILFRIAGQYFIVARLTHPCSEIAPVGA